MKADNEQVTGLLYTKDRHEILVAKLDAIASYGFPVWILDGSDRESRDISDFANLSGTVIYRHLPGLWVSDRYFTIMDEIATPYVMSLSDDDVFFSESIAEAADFLDKNESYAAAQGNFWIQHKVDGDFLYDLEAGAPSLIQDDAVHRFRMHLSFYSFTFYAVHRNAVYKQSMVTANDFKEYGFFFEIVQSLSTVAAGKIKRLSSPYCIRKPNSPEELNLKLKHQPDLWINKDPRGFEATMDLCIGKLSESQVFKGRIDVETFRDFFNEYILCLQGKRPHILETSKYMLLFLNTVFPEQNHLDTLINLSKSSREAEIDVVKTMEKGLETLYHYIHFFHPGNNGRWITPYNKGVVENGEQFY